MQTALTALITMVMMLLYAVPGFLFIKTRLLGEEGITPITKLLVYVSQPALMLHTMLKLTYTPALLLEMGLTFAISTVFHMGLIGLFFFLFRKRSKEDARYRIYTVAAAFGNYGFMGIPILETLLPGSTTAPAAAAVCALSLNMVAFTLGSAVISHDRRYVSAKKIILNPATLGVLAALPFFFTNTTPGTLLVPMLDDMIALLSRMSTPICMIVLGMRLALVSPRSVFGHPMLYLIVAVKQLLCPLLMLGCLLLLPISPDLKAAVYILSACPIAAIVQNFAELLGEGQETAAGTVLLGTILSALTIPLMMILLPLL